MRIRTLWSFAALLTLTGLAYSVPADIYFSYVCDAWIGDGRQPLTTGQCWTGTPVPDGVVSVEVYDAANTLLGVNTLMNGLSECGEAGFFVSWDALTIECPGEPPVCPRAYAKVVYQGCVYTTVMFQLVAGTNALDLVQADWNCDCGAPCTPTEEGSDGPYDIPSGSTKVFFASDDTCTVWITAQGGAAHGVTVRVYDEVPQYHPAGFNYMSRVAAVFWNGSADPSTTLLVRMYYTSSEFNESGFSNTGCLIAARFDEFAAHWTPILPAGGGTKYIEFVTDRSGYFTFDCRGTTPRGIPIGDPTVSSADKELVVRWQTMDEFENYRFHILRAEKSEGPYVEIATVNSQLPDIGTTASYDYEYRDSGLENGRTYYYRLGSEDLHGNTVDGLAAVSGVPSLYGDAVQIDEYRLHAAYPNPFNPETRITYDVRDVGRVTLCVFDILGREVARLVDREQARGRYNVTFNARDLPSGLYFYRIDIGGQFTSTQKMLLLK